METYLEELTIRNPKHKKAQELGYGTANIPSTLQLYDETETHYLIPRNYDKLPGDLTFDDFKDERVEGEDINVTTSFEPREGQAEAIEAMVNNEGDGVLCASCGKGKTAMSVEIASRIGKTTLILVHKSFLMEQWCEEIKKFTGEEAGIIRGDRWEYKGKKFVVGMLQTFYARRDEIPEDVINHFGLVISDEVHRVSAPTFSRVIQMFPAKRRIGLSATPKRSDGLEIIFHLHIGHIVYEDLDQELSPTVFMVQTNTFVPKKQYYLSWNNKPNLPKLVTALSVKEERNDKILRLLVKAAKSGRKVLVLSDRVAQVELFQERFEKTIEEDSGLEGVTTSIYMGSTSEEEREIAVTKDIIFATTKMAKEGLNIVDLDTLFLTSPTSSEITVQQASGRILREHPAKKDPMVVDFVDKEIPMLKGMAKKRWKIYNNLEYDIEIV